MSFERNAGSTNNQSQEQASSLLDNVPFELRARKQFVCWRLEERTGATKPTKVPYSPWPNGGKADVTDPATWGTWQQARSAPITSTEVVPWNYENARPAKIVAETGFTGIGFVFSHNDEYTGIDLDDTKGDAEAFNRQKQLVEHFDSYTELSPSGTGVHIIVKGKVPSGRRRDHIELYPHDRFFTLTGNVIKNVGIAERKGLLDILYQEMGGEKAEFDASPHYKPATETDEQVDIKARMAANGQKYADLTAGDWQTYLPGKSISEAALALMDIIAFYTSNPEQMARIFGKSYFGTTKHFKNPYHLKRLINLAFDRHLSKINHTFTAGGKPSRAGIKASDLQHMQFPPVAWIVPGVITQGLTILGGRPKLGKSWLCLDTALAVAEGGYVLGSFCQPGDVAYYALEDTQRRLKSRMWKVRGEEPWPSNLELFVELPRGAEGLAQVRCWLEENPNAKLILIDTLAKVRPVNKNENRYDADYQAVADWKSLADEFDVAIVLVHHTRKQEAEDPLEMISGTNGITGAADSIIILERNGQGSVLLGRGRDLEEFAISIRLDESCRWQNLGDVDDAQRSDQRNAIINVLRQSEAAMSPKDIAHSLGADESATRQLLLKMVNKGELEKSGRGQYVLPPHIPPHNNDNNGNRGLL